MVFDYNYRAGPAPRRLRSAIIQWCRSQEVVRYLLFKYYESIGRIRKTQGNQNFIYYVCSEGSGLEVSNLHIDLVVLKYCLPTELRGLF